MNVREAKDFLVQQTLEQASLEHVQFSDLEKRMMYFAETEKMAEDPIALNEAFEAEYDSAEYEKKVSKLLRNAHTRIKKESPQSARTWDESVQELRKGDHYLLLLLDSSASYPPKEKLFSSSFWKLLGIGLLTLSVAMIVFATFLNRAESMPPRGPAKGLSPQAKYFLLGLAVILYLIFALLPGWVAKAWWWTEKLVDRKKSKKI